MAARAVVSEPAAASRLRRELLLFAPVYLGLAFIALQVKLHLTRAFFDGTLERNHALLLARQYTNNEQSRPLQFLVPELLHRVLGLTLPHAYALQRWGFVFLALLLFHGYLRAFFDRGWALAGVALLAAVMPLAAANDLQESAPLLLAVFVAGLWAIRDRRLVALAIVYAVGGLVNETAFFLPVAHFANEARSWRLRALVRAAGKTVLVALPLFATQGPIRYVNRDRPHLGGAWHLPDNLHGIAGDLTSHPLDWYRAEYLYVVFIFGALWIYAGRAWRTQPDFLRRAAAIVPPFVIGHLLTGITAEVRQMLPLGFVIIPLALSSLRSDDGAAPASDAAAR